MATVIPSLSTIRGMTPSERRLGRRRHPDHIILHPCWRLLFLRVKGREPDRFKAIDPKRVESQTRKTLDIVGIPPKQVRRYANIVSNQLLQDQKILLKERRFKGAGISSTGTEWCSIARKQWNESMSEQNYDFLLPPHSVTYRDDMTVTADREKFQMCPWSTFEHGI